MIVRNNQKKLLWEDPVSLELSLVEWDGYVGVEWNGLEWNKPVQYRWVWIGLVMWGKICRFVECCRRHYDKK